MLERYRHSGLREVRRCKRAAVGAGISHCVVAEPLELIASMLLSRAMVRAWHMQRRCLPAAVLRERAVAKHLVAAGHTTPRPQHTCTPG